NTFSTPSTTSWCSAATSDLPVTGVTLGMMTSSFVYGEENEEMQTLLCHSVTGNALSSEKSGTNHCELTKFTTSVRLSPIASGAASSSSTGRCRRLTQKVG